MYIYIYIYIYLETTDKVYI